MKKIVVMLIVVASTVSMSYGAGCPFSKCGVGKSKKAAATCTKAQKQACVVDVCTSCGEVKGSAKCCKADAKKCKDCGLNKKSPSCCKLGAAKAQKACGTCPKTAKAKAACSAKNKADCGTCPKAAKATKSCCGTCK